MKWNDVAPHVILSIPTRGNTNRNILTEYQSIFSTNIVGAFAARTNDRAIQNSKAFYATLSKSVTRNISNTVFRQAKNLPTNEYGVEISKLFTLFTVVAFLQLLVFSFNQITSLFPSA